MKSRPAQKRQRRGYLSSPDATDIRRLIEGSDAVPDPFNQTLPYLGITIAELDMDELGSWVPPKCIAIRRDQPAIGKHITLLHEALHAVDDIMRAEGITRRRVPHGWIENAACNLLLFLVAAGLWRGVEMKELVAFIDARDTQ